MALEDDFDELIPSEEPLSADEMLAASERLVLDSADGTVVEIEDGPAPVGRSIAWDFASNQAIMAGHGPLTIRAEQTIAGWIEKALRTAEGAHPVHPPGYGMTRPIEDYLSDQHFDEGGLTEDIERAILFHPSISSVEDIVVEYVDDDDEAVTRVYISLTAVLDDESEIEVGTDLPAVGEALV